MVRYSPADFDEWRSIARHLIAARVTPEDVQWSDGVQPLLGDGGDTTHPGAAADEAALQVPRELLRLLQAVAQHRDPHRWDLMYRLLWRVSRNGRAVLEDAAHPELRHAQRLAKEVRRDLHKMHAFVRFREAEGQAPGEPPHYVAWFEPDHLILREGARFFARRFGSMHWTLVTPEGAAVWDQRTLRFVDAPDRDTLPRTDALEEVWRTYYRSICNAARLRPAAMQREMPRKYWKNLPEVSEIGALLRDSSRRVAHFDDPAARAAAPMHAPIRSAGPTRPQLADTLDACRRCELWERATQAVAGEGPPGARIMLVGEQPGDEEDLRGRPFVGPAGRLLDELLQEVGLERSSLYVTNAVKHFKWEPRGRRRLHKTPAQREVAACQDWLLRELRSVRPAVVVALGGTALHSLTGSAQPVAGARGRELQARDGTKLIATYHPSALLRAPPDVAESLRRALLEDLREAAAVQVAAPIG